jgi:type IV secretory pathway TraG/TraD family ATPase VirD4
MSVRDQVESWGPLADGRRTGMPKRGKALLIALAVISLRVGPTSTHVALVFGVGISLALAVQVWINVLAEARAPTRRIANAQDPLAAVLAETRARGGSYLGVDRHDGSWRYSRRERAVLVLGPPRSGKSFAVMIPAVLSQPGAVVSTSTKPDVLRATAQARTQLGRAWIFDPTGSEQVPAAFALRWSPVTAARSWDGALLMARAMVTGAGVGAGTTDGTHWSKRATALLAPLLHAAALDGRGIDRVARWVLAQELDEPGTLLERAGAEVACGTLAGLARTEARERSSIFSAAADALDAYSHSGAIAAATDPNFNAENFVRSTDTIYIHAPAEQQRLAAPLVCGLLSEIRAAIYRAHRLGDLRGRVLFALDEAANIAPLDELPQIASEGGGQGLTLLTAFQDLSQARARWGSAADGFLTLFGSKLILPGVADPHTLEAISLALGEYDRPVVSRTRSPRMDMPFGHITGSTTSTQRQRVMSPGDVAGIPAGYGLHLDGTAWQLLRLTPAHQDEPWRTLTSADSASGNRARR